MPLGGDLGFRHYLVLAGLLVGPVIAFVLHRKWRRSVARREEIKRLLVLASEEAARAELEASSAYYVNSAAASASDAAEISRPLQYQCAVCFSPTATRCARCKAVRYCSGKCQIIHWRQGHKEECRPFTISHQINDVGGGSCQKVLRQEGDEIYSGSFETNRRQFAKSVQSLPEELACSKSNSSPEVFSGNDDREVEYLSDGERTNSSSHKTEISDRHQSANIFPDKLETYSANSMDQNGSRSSKSTTTTSSSGWSADGTNESSFSEPSTPSSSFWEGTLNPSRTKVDTLDDSAQSSSTGTGDGNMLNSRSSHTISFNADKNTVPLVDVRSYDAATFISDGANSSTLGIKEPIERANLSKEMCDDALKGRNSQFSTPEKSDRADVYTSSDSHGLKSGDPRYTSSSAYAYSTSSGGGTSICTHPPNVSSRRSLSFERSNHVINGMSTALHSLASKEGGELSSGASVADLSSSTKRNSLKDAKCGKDNSAQAIASSSSEFGICSPNARNGLKTSVWKFVDQFRGSKSSRHSESGGGSESIARYNSKGLFPYELFVKLYNWNKIELRPCGLRNCGNSCYANAVLQCLACTPPLTAYLLQGLHSEACERKEWCFTCELESLVLKAKEGSSPLSPIGILSQIQNIGSHLGNGREEDAHEFLRYAIDAMQSVCLKEAGLNASGSLEEETTLIGLTFGGYLRSKIKCIKCGGKSERHERMLDLTVEIEGDIGTLEEALRKFTCTEILDGENKYHCSRCRSYEKAKKKLTILEAPNILTIALKRFQSGKFGKLNKAIKFPEILDLAPCMSGTSDKSPVYRLYGVVVHLDVMNAAFSGHYVCYVKTVQNKWFKIDDSTVKAVDLESVLTKGAYMLLYARCSPRAPRFIRNSIVPCDPRKPKNHLFNSRSHPTSPWHASGADCLNDTSVIEYLYPNRATVQPIRTILEEDSSSDNSSSIFSEGCSCSTENTALDSASTDDYFDNFFGDSGRNLNSSWRNLTDSDSSSSSPSSSPSPLYSRHLRLSHSDRYPETSGSQILNAESGLDDQGFWGRRIPSESGNWEGKSSVPFLHSGKSKQCRKLASSSSSCRETKSGGLGSSNPFDNKKSGVSFSRSMREITD